MSGHTGMHRFGFTPPGQSMLSRGSSIDRVEVDGVFTHFARADEHDPRPD
jgi:alanine racemase